MHIKNISYSDYENILNNDRENIISYENNNNIIFNYFISVSKEDHIMNSILSLELQRSSIFLNLIDDEIIFKNLSDIISHNNIKNNSPQKINILLLQSILDIEIYNNILEFLQDKNINLYLYSSTTKNLTYNNMNIFYGNFYQNDIRFPWDKSQFTPINELEKLSGNIRVELNDNNKYFLGFSSSDLLQEVKIQIPHLKNFDSISFQDKEFHNEVIKKDNFYHMHLIEEYELLNKVILHEKINFIEKSGLTHYIESNFQQALLLSQYVKITSILYYEDHTLYQVNLNKTNL